MTLKEDLESEMHKEATLDAYASGLSFRALRFILGRHATDETCTPAERELIEAALSFEGAGCVTWGTYRRIVKAVLAERKEKTMDYGPRDERTET